MHHSEGRGSLRGSAREIGCSRSTLYRAADDGRLNDVEVGGRRMLVKDDARKTLS